MELRTYLAILWRRKWVIAVTTAMTVIVVVVGTLMAIPIYTASTMLRIATVTVGSADWVDYDITYADRLMNTYARVATTGPVREQLAQRLGLDELPQIEVEILANTELLQITVEDQNPLVATEAANALAEILVAQSKELYTGDSQSAQEILREQLAQLEVELNQARQAYENQATQFSADSERLMAARRSIELKEATYATLLEQYEQARVREAVRANTISIVEPATIPESPAKPRWELNIILGLMVGLAGGLGLAFLFESLDTRLYTTKQIEAATKLTMLGQIPTTRKGRQFTFLNGNSPEGEAFRRLRTNIFNFDHNRPLKMLPLKTLLVTSAEPGEGKSTIVANLAYTMAQTERKILVVDGDLRLPTLHKIFNLSNELGLSSILNDEATLAEAIQDSRVPGIQVLTSGPLPANPAEILGSPPMKALIEQLSQQFDLILLDTPALLAVTDAIILTTIVDAVLFVVGRGQAQQETVQTARQQLAAVKARLIGAVVNRAEQNSYYNYYQYRRRTPT